jgi:hypothetical protein
MPPGPLTARETRHGGGGRAGLAIVIVIVVALCLGGAAFLVHRHRTAGQATPPQSAPAQSAPAASTTGPATAPVAPAAVVAAYFRAINHHRYARAWALGGRDTGESYSQFVSGFSDTAHDAIQISSVSGGVVTARLVATQTGGSTQTFQGTYTVAGGRITQFNIRRVS